MWRYCILQTEHDLLWSTGYKHHQDLIMCAVTLGWEQWGGSSRLRIEPLVIAAEPFRSIAVTPQAPGRTSCKVL